MNIITRKITVKNTGSVGTNIKVTLILPSPVSITSFSSVKGYLNSNVWTIPTMQDNETVEGTVNLLVPSNYQGTMKVDVFGKVYEVDLSDNTASSSLSTTDSNSCAPPNAECGQPTVSLLEGFTFGVINGNMAVNSCLSTKCLHRFSVSDLVNVSNLEFNKVNGDYSLQPTNPFLPWSFNFRVESYDCTVSIKGKTRFEADGPKPISGPALYTRQNLIDAISEDIKSYDTREEADEDTDLVSGEWFTVKDSTYPDQATLNVKL